MKDKFIKFLEDNGAYEKYVANIPRFRGGIDYLRYMTTPDNYLDCMFAWDFTKEGRQYWAILDHKWQKLLKTPLNNLKP